MKKIIINGRFLLHRVTGVERYAREILSELDKILLPGEYELAVPPEVDDIPHYKNIKITKMGKLHNRLWEHISFPLYVIKNRAISLNLCNVAPLIAPGIVCIMDTKIKSHPEFYSKKFLFWYRILFFNAIKRSKLIITISEFSKNEICKYYHIDRDNIVVVPCAWQHFERVGYADDALKKYDLEEAKYYFSMCSLEPNKNFAWIAETARREPDSTFAIAGSINKKVFADGLGFECPDNMKLLGYVSDEEAKTLMRYCKGFLFPSIYEGFGIPPLEAMSAGCPNVIVSDTPVMHEVFDNSVSYIDLDSYTMPAIRDNMHESNDQLAKYSWEISAIKMKKELARIG